jgi:predicted TIM-barrel fold metal-dependent hydrolase
MAHLVSIVAQGVFEKYRNLHLIVVGAGVMWIPWAIWRFNSVFEAFGNETPWLKRSPADYIRDHVLISTWPIERAGDPSAMRRALNSFLGVDQVLTYASGYPDAEEDSVPQIAAALPREWLPGVFAANAMRAYVERQLSLESLTAPSRHAERTVQDAPDGVG